MAKAIEGVGGLVNTVLGLGAPDLPAAKEAPSPDDSIRRRAKERAAKKKYGAGGRAGTSLSEGVDKLG